MQLAHNQFKASSIQKDLILMCDNIESPANMGSIFRLCDAFGVRQIIIGGKSPRFTSGRFKKAARSSEKYVRFRESENILNTLEELHKQGYQSLALEITSNSKSLQDVQIESKKIVLIIGNERHGISKNVLQSVAHQGHIIMYGKNSSMNVAQATAIALYELTRA